MMLKPPIKKSNYYFCKLLTNDSKQFKLNIPYASIMGISILSKQQGYHTIINVPQDDYAKETIISLEKYCLQEMVRNNNKWFNNNLTEDKINDLFESSVIEENAISLYVSLVRTYFSGENVSIGEWLEREKNNTPKNISLSIICDGLFIYKHKFGLRWVIKEINKNNEDYTDEIIPDKNDIVDFWQDNVNEYINNLDELSKEYETKISDIKKNKQFVISQMEKIKITDVSYLDTEINELKELMKI